MVGLKADPGAAPGAAHGGALARDVHPGPELVASATRSRLGNAQPALAKAQIARASVQQQALGLHASDSAARRKVESGRHAALAEVQEEALGPTVPSANPRGIVVQIGPLVDQVALSAVPAVQRVRLVQGGRADQRVREDQRVRVLSAIHLAAMVNHGHPSVKGRRGRKATVPSSGRTLPQAIVLPDEDPRANSENLPAVTARSTSSHLARGLSAAALPHAPTVASGNPGPSAPLLSVPAVPADSASQVAGRDHLANPDLVSRPTASLQAIALRRAKLAQTAPARRVPYSAPAHAPTLHPVHQSPAAFAGQRVPASPSASLAQRVHAQADLGPQAQARVALRRRPVPASRAAPAALANPAAVPRPRAVRSPALPGPVLPGPVQDAPAASVRPSASRVPKGMKARMRFS
jgi:hypothetical protein